MTNGTEDSAGANGADAGGHAVVAGTVAALFVDPAVRDELKRRVEETTQSVRIIAGDLGVSQASLARAIKERGWQRPEGAPKGHGGPTPGASRLATGIAEAGRVSARLVRAVDRQVGKIESKLKKRGAEIEEKDARILGHLARTLATLMALDRDDGATANEPEPVDRDARNAELARRIARWAEGGEGP